MELAHKGIHTYRYLLILAVLNTMVLCTSNVVAYKLTMIGPFLESANTIMFPLTYVFGDVIAEVYGYKVARHIIWISLFACLLSGLLVTLAVQLPAPNFWHDQQIFIDSIGSSFRVAVSSVVGVVTGAFINAYALTKWKILTRGRLFWLRSLSSTAIGEAVLTVVSVIICFAGKLDASQMIWITYAAYLYKLVFAIIVTIPLVFLVKFLKQKEGIDVFDYHTDFNPFKISLADKT